MAAKKTTRKAKPARPRVSGPVKAAPTTTTVINIIPNSLSGESNQDSEPHLSVNPANPLQIGASAFSPNPGGGALGPIYKSFDGGNTWRVDPIVPSSAGNRTGTFDITTSFDGDGQDYYAGIINGAT